MTDIGLPGKVLGVMACLVATGYLPALGATSANAAACTANSVPAPDGTYLSILFDDLQVDASTTAKSCSVSAALNLPPGYSLGVYRVDYRGFAQLAKGQTAELGVDYALGPKGNGRTFQRKVHGPSSADFTFTENIGAGLMKRVGCGIEARLNVTVSLSLSGKSTSDAEADLDSSDSASKRGLVYFFDLKKCQP